MRLLLVRHGESAANAAGIYQGWLDSPLSARGEAQAAATARALAARDDLRVVAVYASPLARAWHTGAAIAAALGLAPIAEPGLREIDVGAATGLAFAAVRERWPDLEELRRVGGRAHRWPEGESGHDFAARVGATVEAIIARHLRAQPAAAPEEAVVLASHGGTIRFALAHLRDESDGWPDDTVDNCSIAEVVIGPAARRVVAVNGRDHLAE
jgi:broad specificity phosphatase PhoE